MPATRHVEPRNGDVLLLVGTMKGLFVLRANKKRAKWETGGPYFPGSAVYAVAYDGRARRHRIWAGPQSMHWGGLLRSSDNFGRTWTNPEEANVKFPTATGAALKQIWQVVPGRESERDTLYCGVEPAALFVSRDAGKSWSLAEG
ncbi:MAG: WD40/YVTN/BNR-like repeat-containing protein, partial [Thermoanaerobaculia bacterium]